MALEEMDGSFGAITQTIKNLGIDNNTIIVFTSDNGLISYWANSAGFFYVKPRHQGNLPDCML